MKKRIALFTLLFVLLVGNLNAQWYQRKYGVSDINDLTEEQLTTSWEKALRSSRLGGSFVGLGTAMIVCGIIVGNNFDSANSVREGFGIFFTTGALVGLGIFLDIIGIPIWISSTGKKQQIRSVEKFNEPKKCAMSITPRIEYNKYLGSNVTGMSITLNF